MHRRITEEERAAALDRDGDDRQIGDVASLVQVRVLDPAAGRHVDAPAPFQLPNLLRQLAAQGRTIVLSSHILEEVEQLAETVLLIVNGKLAASGGFRAIRAALNQRPYHVRILCDEPRTLAASVVRLPAVDAVHVLRPSQPAARRL